MVARDEFRFRFGQVKRRAVRFPKRADQVNQEADRLKDRIWYAVGYLRFDNP
jgi:hypothetical protein